VEYRFASGDNELVGELVGAGASSSPRPGLVLCHGMPTMGGDILEMSSFPGLAELVSERLDWVVLTFRFRGCNPSEGEFSLQGWLDDLRAAISELSERSDVESVWAAGFGTGGALGICAAARDDRVCGVAAVASPADFDDWAENPVELLDHVREVGALDPADEPDDLARWSAEIATIRACDLAATVAPRPMLVVHGGEDQMVPIFDARELASRNPNSELVVIPGAGHGLRDDPRAIASLLGWLDRQVQIRRAEQWNAPVAKAPTPPTPPPTGDDSAQ
jgi:putative redox protein